MQTSLLGVALYMGDNDIGEIVAVSYDATDETSPVFVFMTKSSDGYLSTHVMDNVTKMRVLGSRV